jgi:hypothetical protein
MARKAKRRYFPTRRPTRGRPDSGERSEAIDLAARQLVEQHSLDELEALLQDRTAQYDEADRAGTNDPSPVNLARYRAARTALSVAQRAVALASDDH